MLCIFLMTDVCNDLFDNFCIYKTKRVKEKRAFSSKKTREKKASVIVVICVRLKKMVMSLFYLSHRDGSGWPG